MPTDTKKQDERRKGFILSVAKTTESSPLVAKLVGDGGNVVPRVIAHRHQAFWNATKDHVLGSDETILTDLGNLRSKNPDVWRAGKALARKAVDNAPPSMSAHMNEAYEKMDEPRGILDVESFAKKLSLYGTQVKNEIDTTMLEQFRESLVVVFNRHADAMRQTSAVRIEEIQKWIPQLNPNRNSGNPDYTPVSKEQAVGEYWPVLKDAIIDIVKNGNMDRTLPPYTDNVYAGFHRSPNRPIHGSGIFDKLIGTFLNFHLVDGLKGKTMIAWDDIDDMFVALSEAMGSAESTMHDDFDGYDGHFSLPINQAMYDAFLESNMFDSQPELRNAFEWFCRRLTSSSRGDPAYLQISPTHAFEMQDRLFSGMGVTQYWGCIFHEAFYEMLTRVYGFGIIDARVLSDDGIAVMETDQAETSRLMDTYARPLAQGLGHELHPSGKKSYVADLTNYVKMHPNSEDEVHDMGPFLQYYPQRDPALSFGNVPRRIYSLFERERDSTDATRLELLSQMAPSLSKVVPGTDKKHMAGWVSDLHRSLDVISTIRPRYPRMREVLRWFAKVYPNFWKKFQRLYTAANPDLWDERSMMAGGTRQAGSAEWVVDYYKRWEQEGVAPLTVDKRL